MAWTTHLTDPNSVSDSSIDFVLVTALPEERDAVLEKLPGYSQLPPAADDIRTYFHAELPVTFPDHSEGRYRIIVMCLLGMGRIQAVTATTDAIKRWHPRYIVLIGIAGGIAARNVKVGDILIADQIVDYELQKLTPEGPQVRWEVQRADARLLNAYANLRSDNWSNLMKRKRPGRGKPNRHIGPVASGDKVIAFGEVLTKYKDVWPKLLGVEMEAAGVATAAFQSADKPGFFMVRGVSDLADENKGSSAIERWRSYACDVAASFAMALLQSGPVTLLDGSRQVKTKQVQLVIEGKFTEFTSIRQQEVIAVLAILLNIDPNYIRVLQVHNGSIRMVIEVPASAADRLYTLALAQDFRLKNLGVKSIVLEDREAIELVNTLPVKSGPGAEPPQQLSIRDALRALRSALVTLYNNPTSIRRLVDDAGIVAGIINFQGSAQDIWYSVITEAERQARMPALVNAVDQAYQNNQALQLAYQAYQQAVHSSGRYLSQLAYQPDNKRSHMTINTGGGPYIAGNVNTGGDFIGRDQHEDKLLTPEHSAIASDELIGKVKNACRKLLTALAKPRNKKILSDIENWLNVIPKNSLYHPEVEDYLIEVYPKVVEKFVAYARENLQNFKNPESKEYEIQDRLDGLFHRFANPDPDIRQPLDDLKLVVAYLFHAGAFQTHDFVDAVLAGAYANLAWAEEARRTGTAQLLEGLHKDAHVEADVYQELVMGAFTCDQNVQTTQSQLSTLLNEVADDYVTQRYRKIYRDTYPWWEGMIRVIDAIDVTKPEIAHWCEARRNEKARYEHNKQRIEHGLPPRRLLWPLELSDDANKRPDANYDFPPVAERVDELANQASYLLGNSAEDPKINAFDVCQNDLSTRSHHVVTGNRRAGKTWLRLYLEYFSLMTDEKLLPLFYFAPASLAFQTSGVEIVQHLARSVANHLFADLLVRSGNRTPTSDPWRASRVAIVPFLQRYGYEPPSDADSLAQPIPPKQLLDIDLAYGKSYLASVYTPMKEAIDAVSFAEYPTPTVEDTFDDIQRAIELAGYQRMFVLVDNWDELQAIPRRRLLGHLLDPHLLSQLSQRGIFLKLFMPESATALLSHFEKSCELQRASTHQLTLYTYAESKPVQTSAVGA
ncbi:MAG: effector-associated domain EAD1-containing protein [Caldilineaceae bacterium]